MKFGVDISDGSSLDTQSSAHCYHLAGNCGSYNAAAAATPLLENIFLGMKTLVANCGFPKLNTVSTVKRVTL